MDDSDGETYFGSRQAISTSLAAQLSRFLNEKHSDELGRASDWLGRYLSGLFALDYFLNNPDRTVQNFALEQDGSILRLQALDFADARLGDATSDRFPVAASNTVLHGRRLRQVHGFFEDSALEMIDRIGAVPREMIQGILGSMPHDWMADEQKQSLYESWASDAFSLRLSALRIGVSNGSFF